MILYSIWNCDDAEEGERGEWGGRQRETEREGVQLKYAPFQVLQRHTARGTQPTEGAAQECFSSVKEAEAPPKGEGTGTQDAVHHNGAEL